MIIQIRGTSGSGKSTVMRRIMDMMGDWQAVYEPGRKKPLYYYGVNDWPPAVVLGHYETACGGCDTIGSAAAVSGLTARVLGERPGTAVVLQEGLLLSEDVKWTSLMTDVRVIFLATPVGDCLRNIAARRAAAGNNKEVRPDNTVNRVATIARARLKLTNAGVRCVPASADQAVKIALNWMRELCKPNPTG